MAHIDEGEEKAPIEKAAEEVVKTETGEKVESDNASFGPVEEAAKADIKEQHQFAEVADVADDAIYSTPFIPDEVFSNLPELLKDSASNFDNLRERDVYLISAVTVLSACFKSVTGEYRQRTVYPNLFSFVIAPPASGKGVMDWGKRLGNTIHQHLIEESERQQRKYELELMAYKGQLKKAKKDEIDLSDHSAPVEPSFKVLFIPGDVSSTRLIDHLVANDGIGIFAETEADTMAASFERDWGGFSDKLCKSFHHEHISYSRVGNSRFKEVPCPRLSVLLTGTPSQVKGIIGSIAGGLFSRFIFYTYKEVINWKLAFPKNRGNLTDYFNALAKTVASYAEFLEQSNITFSLTEQQEAKLDSICSAWLKESAVIVGEEARASAIRMGLILYRLAMTLSTIRMAESKELVPRIVCSDTDFDIAVALSGVFKEHAYFMLRQIQKHANRKETMTMQFLRALPDGKEFQRAEAVKVGKALNIGERTIGTYLSNLVAAKLLEYPNGKHGIYKKVTRQNQQTLQSVPNSETTKTNNNGKI